MKLNKEQIKILECILAWRDFALAMNREEAERIKKETIKMIKDNL